ncbi:LANO_0F14114g1_1 [Lachancea nothofagi CBS 11611]|uniref:Transcription initiation factor TFIID subunit 8 n=1 Tax=Lachancea nothofagi CBS 11611 TaxID=1266666 RepID=A0A1G4KC41_9SACH|nr:LANO_0F14114g1_1 [Lachancea nothofagi CBS 11611]
MVKTEPSSPRVLSDSISGVQLKKLPNLSEIPKGSLEDPLKKILEKAIAIQLRSINENVTVSQFAFENLVLLVEETLSGMMVNLHKVANIQRRHCISKKDLLLVIEGYNLTCADLMQELERSQYVRSQCLNKVQKIEEDSDLIVDIENTPLSQEELSKAPHPEFFVKDKDILKLVPPSVRDVRHVPKWLPEFPPDHTYKFTSLYNKPITDERQMKRKLAEESDLSEKALIHLSRLSSKDNKSHIVDNDEVFQASLQETQLIFKPAKKKRPSAVNEVNDLLRTLPQKNYNVEEYARNRVEIARRRVSDYERHQLQMQKAPFIKATHLLSPFAKERINCKTVEKEVKTLLYRSYVGLLRSVPLLIDRRKQETAMAEDNRRAREEQMRKEREELNKNSKEFDELDLSNLNEDPFFGGLESSDSEAETERQTHDMTVQLEQQAGKYSSQDSTGVVADAIEEPKESGSTRWENNSSERQEREPLLEHPKDPEDYQNQEEINDLGDQVPWNSNHLRESPVQQDSSKARIEPNEDRNVEHDN